MSVEGGGLDRLVTFLGVDGTLASEDMSFTSANILLEMFSHSKLNSKEVCEGGEVRP